MNPYYLGPVLASDAGCADFGSTVFDCTQCVSTCQDGYEVDGSYTLSCKPNRTSLSTRDTHASVTPNERLRFEEQNTNTI